MKVLLFGKMGQVGWELNRSLQPLGEIVALGRDEADFSNPESIRTVVQTIKPDVIVNAVAYTNVDKAEEDEALALIVNAVVPRVLAEEAKNLGVLLVHYSTDYVFDGAKDGAYLEDDVPDPINVYGRTKLAGEAAVQQSGCDYLIFRTSWVYASRGHNFLLTILRLVEEKSELSVVSDQVGAPTSARLIADTTLVCLRQSIKERCLEKFSSGLYHLTAQGNTSWHGFAEKIVATVGKSLQRPLKTSKVEKMLSAEYPTLAKRPMNSQLQLNKLESTFDVTMPVWSCVAALCIEEITDKL